MNNDNGQKAFRIVGSIELSTATLQPDQAPEPPTQSLSVSGALVSANYGYPLPGLKVSAYFVASEASTSECESGLHKQSDYIETLLGSAIADHGGRFNITFRETPGVRHKLYVLTQFADSFIALKVEGNDDQLFYTSEPLSATDGSIVVTLPVPLPDADLTSAIWAALGARLGAGRPRAQQVH